MKINNELSGRSISPLKINRKKYLESLLEAALSDGFIDENAMRKISDELKLFLVNHVIENKTPGLSSIDEKRLDLIADSALYFIGLGLSELTPDKALKQVLNLNFRVIYENGVERGFSFFERITRDFLRIKGRLFSVRNAFFIDLVETTIPSFIENVERFERGTDALIELSQADKYFDFLIDVARFDSDCAGVEKVSSYLHALVIENEFLLLFDPSSVERLNSEKDALPRVYDPFLGDFDFTGETGFIPALSCAVKLTILGKNPQRLEFDSSDRETLSFLLRGKPAEQINELSLNSLRTIKEIFFLDEEVYEYAESCLTMIRFE